MLTTIHLGARVASPEGTDIGKVKFLIADPNSRRLTHIVVENTQGDRRLEKLVEVNRISAIAEDGAVVQVDLGGQTLDQLQDFMEQEYVTSNLESADTGDAPLPINTTPYLYPSTATQASGMVGSISPVAPIFNDAIAGQAVGPVGAPVGEQLNVPENSLIIQAGTGVEALDGRLGHIKDVNVDPASGQVVSFVIEKGFIFTHEVTIPVEMVDSASQELVSLRVNREDVEKAQSTLNQPPANTTNYYQP